MGERSGHELVWSKIMEVLSQANIEKITTERSARCAIKLLFSHYVLYDSLQPHELQHARLPCPSLSP